LILDTVGGIEDIICYAFCKMLSVCDIYVYKTKVPIPLQPSTVSLWHNLDILLEIAQVYHVLNLELKKILVNIQRIMVKGPENKAFVGLSDCRTIGPSDYRTVGLSDCRIIGRRRTNNWQGHTRTQKTHI
jgi:hypothetical protein